MDETVSLSKDEYVKLLNKPMSIKIQIAEMLLKTKVINSVEEYFKILNVEVS